MKELFEAAFSMQNIIPTLLLCIILIYWLTVIIGVLDFSFLDFDVDVDVDIDTDVSIDTEVDADVDADSDGHISISWLNHILHFFNIGRMPFMIFMSFLALPLWFISIQANYYLPINSVIISIVLLIPNLIISLFIAKILTWPFIKIFDGLNKRDTGVKVEGKMCVAIMHITEDRFGQVEITEDGIPIKVLAYTTKGKEIKAGETALVIEYNQETEKYLVEPYKLD